jgi:hypothetical protein
MGPKVTGNLKPLKESDANKLLLLAVVCGCVSVGAFVAASFQPKKIVLPHPNEKQLACRPAPRAIVSYPSAVRGTTKVTPWNVFDQRTRMGFGKSTPIDAPGIPGGNAETIIIERREALSHVIGASILNQRSIDKDDQIVAQVWLRAKPSDNAKRPIVIDARPQENEIGYRGLSQTSWRLRSSFAKYEIRARADKLFCPDDLNFALHLATGAQSIDIGPATIKIEKPTSPQTPKS